MLTWYEKKENNIETNHLEFWFAVDKTSKYMKSYRYFYIVPQYPSKDGVMIESGSDPELYVLFEGRCSECDKEYDKIAGIFDHYYDLIVTPQERYFDSSKSTFLRAFKTLEEAKNRAEYNIKHMNSIKEIYFGHE